MDSFPFSTHIIIYCIAGLLYLTDGFYWISVRGWGRIMAAGAALLGRGSKVGGGGFRGSLFHQQTLNGLSAVVTNYQMHGKPFWAPLTH